MRLPILMLALMLAGCEAKQHVVTVAVPAAAPILPPECDSEVADPPQVIIRKGADTGERSRAAMQALMQSREIIIQARGDKRICKAALASHFPPRQPSP